MFIARVPLRVSYFGGGTDFPEWFNLNNGLVLSSTINKYCYILIRELPPFFPFKYRIRYYNTETVKTIDQIKHPTVKQSLKHFYKKNSGLEIIHFSDLPSLSGLGASSAFTVGILRILFEIKKKKISNYALANNAIFIEKKILKESCGYQDQFACAVGGFNEINFKKNKIHIKPISTSNKNKKALEDNTSIFFTGVTRHADLIEKEKIKKMKLNKKLYKELYNTATEAKKIFASNTSTDDFLYEISSLMRESWNLKKNLSSKVSNSYIDQIYQYALSNGAVAGKILGAGGGGFMMLLSKSLEEKKRLISKLSKLKLVNFKFENSGCKLLKKNSYI
jgi:D-glycero-alpha-D-manno-heptose-7-phosphate kinase